MDARIFFADGGQLSAIRTQDLPVLAKAIAGYERGFLKVEKCQKRNVSYVRFFAASTQSFELNVLESDWRKIVPHLVSGEFNPFVGPPGIYSDVTPKDFDNLEVWDARFVQKVYQALQLIFTQSYPTSNL